MGETIRTRWFGYAAALATVAFVSVIIGIVLGRIVIANISMLYLIAVLTTAVLFGSGPAVVASIAAFLTFDWFFVEPVHTFTVADPSEWVSLLLFLLTAMITGQLAADQRRRAREAVQREREAVVLYDVVRLMGEPGFERALRAVAERVRQELRLAAVAIELPQEGRAGVVRTVVGEDEEALRLIQQSWAGAPTRVLGEGRAPADGQRGAPGRWVRVVPTQPPGRPHHVARDRLLVVPVKSEGGRRVGALLLVRPAGATPFTKTDDRLLSAVAAQVGLAFERARLRHEATEAEVLRRTDELKSALIGAVSHDLRTPLATIMAAADSLCQRDVSWSEEERAAFARDIADEAQRLGRLVNNLLDLSRIEGGSLRPQKAWHDLSGLVQDVLERLEPLTAGHRMLADIPDDLPPLLLDYVEIDQMLSNLIENAVKYTPKGTEIAIRAARAGGEVQVEVADRGPGLPPKALGRVFERFYRAEGIGPRPRGTGLGLAVAKGMVEAHGGRIWAENRPGGGARFVFTLPVVEQPEARHAGAPGDAA